MSNQYPPYGTAFSDGVRVGGYRDQNFNFASPGISLSPVSVYSFTPSSQAQTIFDGNVPSPGGRLQLIGTFVEYQGYSSVLPLNNYTSIWCGVSSGSGFPITITISGWDIWGQELVDSIVLTSTTSFFGNKIFSYVKSIYSDKGISDITILAGEAMYGLPFFAPDASCVMTMFGGRPDYGITVSGNGTYYLNTPVPFSWPSSVSGSFSPGDGTDPATATTGDVRGSWSPSLLEDGQKKLVFRQYVPGFDPMQGTVLAPDILSPTQSYCYGVPQFTEGWE